MVEPYIPDKETQWNMEKDSGCEQVEQGNREITLQNAKTRRSPITSQLNGLCNIPRSQISISPLQSISKLKTILSIQLQQQQQQCKQSNAFWTKHSPTFFADAIESILRQIRIHSQVKILNQCDDKLLILQDKQIFNTQTIEMMKTLKQLGWIISTEKCESEPNQIIFLGQIWNLKEMNIRMSEQRKLKMKRALNFWYGAIQKNKCVKKRQLAALKGRLNFLRLQIKEASVYPVELDNVKTQALKTKSWDEMMIVNNGVITELK
ncbi:MAG: hypothetical protein EZS28_034134 [Streblomastix strix]|uniref:Reverse transcriptase domain-containing protein n=1 Tax=Streblomastix strix TaxID=222440 RepID=A0A5J4UJT4_9EUKA|nr:MAG: hypothetical protein EZS28_034134 [Streblomastix strix]